MSGEDGRGDDGRGVVCEGRVGPEVERGTEEDGMTAVGNRLGAESDSDFATFASWERDTAAWRAVWTAMGAVLIRRTIVAVGEPPGRGSCSPSDMGRLGCGRGRVP